MRFMSLWRPGKHANPLSPKMIAEMDALLKEMGNKMVLTGGWDPTAPASHFHSSQAGKITIKDGPFAESKEVVAGFAIVDVASKEEAIHWTQRFLELAGEGTAELRSLDDHGSAK